MFTINKNFSIKSKLMLFYGIIYLAFALSFTLFYYISARNSLNETFIRQMDNTLKGITTVVQTSINTAVKNYLRFNSESNYSRIMDINRNSEDESKLAALQLIEDIQKKSQVDNYIIDLNGILQTSIGENKAGDSLWSKRDDEGRFYIQSLISKAYALPESAVDSISHQSGSEIIISVFSYLKSRNWVIISSISRNELKSFIDVNDFRDDIVSLGLGNNGSVEIFDNKGLQIIHSAKQFEGNIRESVTHNIMVDMLNGRIIREERMAEVSSLDYVTTSSESQNNKMINKIYSFNVIPDMGWFIAVGIDRDEVFAPLHRLRNISIITTFLFFLALVGMSLIASEKIIMQNLRLLTKAISNFENKQFDTRVKVFSHDELEKLSRSFNSMAETIEDYSIHMERIIVERTHDLVQSEKMAALGSLVAGIAHEINTPIGITVTASSHLQNEVKKFKTRYADNNLSKSELSDFIKLTEEASSIIFKSISNAGALIRRFKKIAVDQSVDEARLFHFREYLEDVILSLNTEFKKWKMDIVIDCDKELILDSDPSYFYQIFYNLILNSLIHGFTEGEKGRLYFNAYIKADDFIFIYEDNGKGIASSSLPHIFEPFYTTRRGKGGTGLGLHIIFNLVTQTLGGTINCESRNGVRFTITIPMDRLKKGNDKN